MNITVLLGAPGSGKGTQAKQLADKHRFKHLSTGDLLRQAVAAGTELGNKAKAYMDRGEYVPDGLMIDLIAVSLKNVPPKTPVLLDGFPRTVPQAVALDTNPQTEVKLAILFSIPDTVLVERLTGRRTCQKCSEVFHVKNLPPKKEGICDRCGGPLTQRSDDTPEVVTKRIALFNQQNRGLVEYYKNRQRLNHLDANRNVNPIQEELLSMVS